MKWEVQLYVAGTVFKEQVHARDYQEILDAIKYASPCS